MPVFTFQMTSFYRSYVSFLEYFSFPLSFCLLPFRSKHRACAIGNSRDGQPSFLILSSSPPSSPPIPVPLYAPVVLRGIPGRLEARQPSFFSFSELLLFCHYIPSPRGNKGIVGVLNSCDLGTEMEHFPSLSVSPLFPYLLPFFCPREIKSRFLCGGVGAVYFVPFPDSPFV